MLEAATGSKSPPRTSGHMLKNKNYWSQLEVPPIRMSLLQKQMRMYSLDRHQLLQELEALV